MAAIESRKISYEIFTKKSASVGTISNPCQMHYTYMIRLKRYFLELWNKCQELPNWWVTSFLCTSYDKPEGLAYRMAIC